MEKYELVTGGSRGIGRSICLKLAEMRYHILINYKSNEAEALSTKSLCEAKQVKAEILQFDVSSKDEIEHTLGQWADLVGFLASVNAAYITGQVVSINGGLNT